MISRKKANQMSAIALLLAAVTIVLVLFREFRGGREWIESMLMVLILALILPAQFAKLKRHTEKRRIAKTTRDTVQKHFWELKHNREW